MRRSQGGLPFNAATVLWTTLVILFLVAASTAQATGLSGSKHDFSTKGWGTTNPCAFCHSVHGISVPGSNAPMWNHKLTTATFTLYSSPTLKKTTQQPRGPSKLCLSCHDGTVAIDSYGTRTGTHYATGAANMTTNLSNDHPISIQWDHQTLSASSSCTACHFDVSNNSTTYTPMYSDGGTHYMECGSCHEPHDTTGQVKMLRYTMSGSQMCLLCHGK